jgi:hypothetical protein
MRQLMALLSFWQNSSASDLSWEAHVGEKVNLQSRRALLKQFAPQYREASYAQKRVLLDVFAQATGYHRRYGMWLLNHAEDVLHAPAYKRSNHYGPEVQHALFLVWNAANRICAKRLIPFLPILIDALERHDYLHISDECAIPTAFHECCDSGSPAVLSAQSGSTWALHDKSGNATEAADPDPHIPAVG